MTLYVEHPSLDKINRFCEGTLPDFEQVVLEEHLVSCEACLGIMNRMEAMLYPEFTAEAHAASLQAEARAADPLMTAIRGAINVYRDFAAVLRGWLDDTAALWGEAVPRRFGQGAFVPVSGTAGGGPVRVVLRSGEVHALVDIQESGESIEVESDAPAESPVLLFSVGEEAFVRMALLHSGSGGSARIARFDAIPAGSYGLAIGPEPKEK